MRYWLSVGLSFDIASTTLKKLKYQEPELFTSGKGKRSPLGVPLAEPLVRVNVSEREEKVSLELVEFDRKKAIASLEQGQPVIPVWLDIIYQQLAEKLGK
ncbi:hypothetical protein [Nostoc sp.]|uniref:hypothetical protein n=1 Tax=Nostoc sp. TaxID=1180 RepID=UPI003593D0D0